jgi:CPA2 family monovalent cation:H+ antiporter-2
MFFLEAGIVLLLAFIGAVLAFKFGQTVMLGYIFIGVLIGPYCLNLIGIELLKEGSFIRILAEIGLVMLLFFIGLEFSLLKLRKTKKPVAVLAIIDVGINMFVGFLIAIFLNWHFIDALFFAAIFAMSSVAIVVKILEDLKMEARLEAEILVSLMIVEVLISVILLAIVSGFSVGVEASALLVSQAVIGIIVLFVFFAILAFIFIPTVLHRLEKAAPRTEFLVLFALALVFLTVALAEFFGIAGIIGAFLVGMAFAETALVQKIKTNLGAFKDVFVAVFFLTFGMMINPRVFPQVFDILIIAIPFVIINELFILSAVAYFIGLPRRTAVTVGGGALGRCEEAIIFATIGTNLRSRATGEYILAEQTRLKLNPFAGLFSLIMCVVTPFFVKNGYKIADWFAKVLPKSMKVSSCMISRILKPAVMAPPLKVESKIPKRGFRQAIALLISITIFAFIPFEIIIPAFNNQIFGIPYHIIFWVVIALLSLIVLLNVHKRMLERLYPAAQRADFTDFIKITRNSRYQILKFVANCITLLFGTIIFVIIALHIDLKLSCLFIIVFAIVFASTLHRFYKKYSKPFRVPYRIVLPEKITPRKVVVIDKKLRVVKVKKQ